MVRLPRARLAAACASIVLLAVTLLAWPHSDQVRIVARSAAADAPVVLPAPPVDTAAIAAAVVPSTTSTTLARRSYAVAAPHAVRPTTASHPTAVAASSSVAVPSDADFDRLAGCESHSRWDLDTGNGFYGGMQFTLGTWRSYGGTGMPNRSPRETQIDVARRVWQADGWRPWPSCSRTVGLA